MGKTAIEWTDRSVNPIRARNRQTGNVGHYCEKISQACKNCYAATSNVKRRFGRKDGAPDFAGTGLDFVPKNRTNVDVFFDERLLLDEAKRKEPSKIFPCDMTDIFGDWVRDDWLVRMWDIMWAAPQHTWQLLTKRPDRMYRFVRGSASRLAFDWCSLVHHPPMSHGDLFSMYNNSLRDNCGWLRHGFCDHPEAEPDGNDDEESGGHPLCHCYGCPIGDWVNDRKTLEKLDLWDEGEDTFIDDDGMERLESADGESDYIQLHSRPRFAFAQNVWLGCTIEDQLQLRRRIHWMQRLRHAVPHATLWLSIEPLLGTLDLSEAFEPLKLSEGCGGSGPVYRKAIDWVVVGGESGPHSRPMHPDWVRSIRDQCQAADVPFFFKQWGEWLHQSQDIPKDPRPHHCMTHYVWPDSSISSCVGKKAAGRRLDGQEWSQFPNVLK